MRKLVDKAEALVIEDATPKQEKEDTKKIFLCS